MYRASGTFINGRGCNVRIQSCHEFRRWTEATEYHFQVSFFYGWRPPIDLFLAWGWSLYQVDIYNSKVNEWNIYPLVLRSITLTGRGKSFRPWSRRRFCDSVSGLALRGKAKWHVNKIEWETAPKLFLFNWKSGYKNQFSRWMYDSIVSAKNIWDKKYLR